MLKIVLEIKEEINEKFKSVEAVGLNVDIQEILINATEGEIKASKILKNRLGINKKVDIVNESKNEKLDKILKELFSI